MRRRGVAWASTALVAGVVLAGCGGDAASGPVEKDYGKDPKLMDAMRGYMEKRSGPKGSKAKAKAKAESKPEAAEAEAGAGAP